MFTLSHKPLRYALLLALASSQAVYAAEEPMEESQQESDSTDRMLVTTSNTALKTSTPLVETPRSVSEIHKEQLEDRGVRRLDEALRYSSGVFASPYGPDNKTDWLVIRGFGWSSYLNGLQTLKENGFYGWQQEMFGVDRIEMLKGPASMLYGQNPPGGLVNVIGKRPQSESANSLELSYGTDDYRHLGFDSTGQVTDDDRILYRMVAFAKAANGPTDGANSERLYLAPSLTFNFSYDTQLTLLASYMKDNTNPTSGFKLPYGTLQNTPFGKVGYRTSLGEPSYGKNNSEQLSLGYELKHNFNDVWSFQQNMSYNYLDLYLRNIYALSMIDDQYANRGLTYRNGSAQSWAVDNRMVGNWLFNNAENTLLLGADYFTANSRGRDANLYSFGSPLNIFNPQYGNYTPLSDNDLFSHRTTREQTGFYVQNQFKYDGHWLFLLGGRFDRATSNDEQENNDRTSSSIDMADNKFTKTAGMMYIADNGMHPYISYSESFQPEVGRDAYGNAYVPITGQQTEIGLKYSPEGFDGYVNAAIYELYQENTFTTDPNRPAVRVQSGKSRARGFELEAANQVTRDLQLLASYTYSQVETYESLDPAEVGKRLPATPKNSASLWANYKFNGVIDKLTVGTGVRYIGSSYGDKTNSPELKVPDYTLVDAMVRYDLTKDLQLQVNVNNLTDKKYVSACDYWCYFGDGRTVVAKVNYRW